MAHFAQALVIVVFIGGLVSCHWIDSNAKQHCYDTSGRWADGICVKP